MEVTQTLPNLSFLLIPHDQRGEVSDVTLSKDLFAALPEIRELAAANLELWNG